MNITKGLNNMQNKLNDIKESLINMFNNAFEDGEEGEELRNDCLAKEYVNSIMPDIKSLITSERKDAVEGFVEAILGGKEDDAVVFDKAGHIRWLVREHLKDSTSQSTNGGTK